MINIPARSNLIQFVFSSAFVNAQNDICNIRTIKKTRQRVMSIQILELSVLALISTTQFHHALCIGIIGVNSESFESSDLYRNPILEGVYETPLDHFSPTNEIRLHQKYEVNTEFFKRGGPIFFYVYYPGGLGGSILIQRGLVYEVARELNGAVVLWRLRYMDFDQIR